VKLLLAFCYNELALGVPTACQVWSAVALSQKKKKKVCASFNKSLKCKQIGRRKNLLDFCTGMSKLQDRESNPN
jgi:hypothetical protein